jgi:MFS family permease
MSSGSMPLIALGIVFPFGVLYAMCYGPEAALFSDLFDARVRYTGISFVYQFSGIFASGLTPIIATWLLAKGGGQPWLICAYVVFAALVSMLSALAMRPATPQPNELKTELKPAS